MITSSSSSSILITVWSLSVEVANIGDEGMLEDGRLSLEWFGSKMAWNSVSVILSSISITWASCHPWKRTSWSSRLNRQWIFFKKLFRNEATGLERPWACRNWVQGGQSRTLPSLEVPDTCADVLACQAKLSRAMQLEHSRGRGCFCLVMLSLWTPPRPGPAFGLAMASLLLLLDDRFSCLWRRYCSCKICCC